MHISNGYSEENISKKPTQKDLLIANLKHQARIGATTLVELNTSSDFKLEQLFKSTRIQVDNTNRSPRI